MSSVFEYCAVCLQDDTKVVAAQVIQQVPLCKGCVVAYGQEKDVLRDAREFMRDQEPAPTKSKYLVYDPNAESSAAPPVKHMCVCGCGEEVLEGTRLIAGHSDPVVSPAPASLRREPDKPLTDEQRKELLGPKKTKKTKKTKTSICLGCGKEYEIGKNARGRYCTRECYNSKQREIEKPVNNKALTKVCKCGCGDSFAPTGNAQQFIVGHKPTATIIRREQEIADPKAATKIVRRTMRRETTAQVVDTQEIEQYVTGSPRISKLHVTLPSGGRLSLEWEGHLFEVSSEDRNFIFNISDRMRSYALQKAVPMPQKSFAILAGIEGGYICDMFDCLDQAEQNRVVEWVQEAAEVVRERNQKAVTK